MKAKVLRKFKDKKDKKLREVGEEFVVSKERFEEINSTKYGKLVEEVQSKE